MNQILLWTVVVLFAIIRPNSEVLAQDKDSTGIQSAAAKDLANTIQKNSTLDTIKARALKLLRGFSAGTSYNEIWIRDFNTFIEGSLKVHSKEDVKKMLLMFFRIQGSDGNIVDGVVDTSKAKVGYDYRYSALLPGWAAHKNTVETDQESSLIQAVKKYITATGDSSILTEKIGGFTVLDRMERALGFVRRQRWSNKFGLVTGATTIDWGDVQPEKGWGVSINAKTKWAIDIYDNAMFEIAVKDLITMEPAGFKSLADWPSLAASIRAHVRMHLWMAARSKYLPHIYLEGSPFSKAFDENSILYGGGSICAIMAGFNTRSEVKEINAQLRAANRQCPHATVGMTVYPPYALEEFPNMKPYFYQNAGDWTWFGARITGALLQYGYAREAYADLLPMVDRALRSGGFYEWYDVQTGLPKGSGDFRGEAGVLYTAITQMQAWAANHK